MADKINNKSKTTSAVQEIKTDDDAMTEEKKKEALLHQFVISALKNIYNAENADSPLTDDKGTSIHSDPEQEK